MSLETEIRALEAKPLLGPPLLEVTEALARCKRDVQAHTPSHVAARVLMLEARVRCVDPSQDTSTFLSGAELWARAHGLTRTAERLRLMWCTVLAHQNVHAIPPNVLRSTIEYAQEDGELEAEWRIAEASAATGGSLRLLQEALVHLISPERDQERLAVWVQMAAIRHDGGDISGAIEHLKSGLNIADRYKAVSHQEALHAMLSQLYLSQGQAESARPHLIRALNLAVDQNNDLAIVTHSTLLCAMMIGEADWKQASTTASRLATAAVKRENWLALSDAHLTQATCLFESGQVAAAIHLLVQQIFQMADFATHAALNLLKGRLVEMRHIIGGIDFDAHFEAAVAQEKKGS